MKKEHWERKLFYLLTPALMGDPFSFDRGLEDSKPGPARFLGFPVAKRVKSGASKSVNGGN
jgi:hypothetical protein